MSRSPNACFLALAAARPDRETRSPYDTMFEFAARRVMNG